MRRHRMPELMDDPLLDRAAHAAALRSLERANRVFAADAPLAAAMRRFNGSDTISLLDLGAGGGDLLERLAARVEGSYASNGRPTDGHRPGKLPRVHPMIGIDVSLQALQLARGWRNPAIQWTCADARRLPFGNHSVDWVVSTLLLHHLDPPDVIALLKEAVRVCRMGIIIADLARSSVAWGATWLVTRLISRSPVFQVDGPRSVRAAFSRAELQTMAEESGLKGAVVRRRFPFRLLLVWRKPCPSLEQRFES